MSPLETLKARVKQSSQSAVARELGVSRQLVNALLKKKRRISSYIAAQLGFSEQVKYIKKTVRQHGR